MVLGRGAAPDYRSVRGGGGGVAALLAVGGVNCQVSQRGGGWRDPLTVGRQPRLLQTCTGSPRLGISGCIMSQRLYATGYIRTVFSMFLRGGAQIIACKKLLRFFVSNQGVVEVITPSNLAAFTPCGSVHMPFVEILHPTPGGR